MTKIYFSGHLGFANRGCEAIIRSTVQELKKGIPSARFLLPSQNASRDAERWPEHRSQGVEFVEVHYPNYLRYWNQFQRLPSKTIQSTPWPLRMPKRLVQCIESSDIVLSVGGDMYTYEGRMPSWIMGVDRLAMRLGKPVVLWGATVGPFPENLPGHGSLLAHLREMALIAVRETRSFEYLTAEHGFKNVIRMTDSAFTMTPQRVDGIHVTLENRRKPLVGVNFSPLIERLQRGDSMLNGEISKFIRGLVTERNCSVVLVPHVMGDGVPTSNDDAIYLASLLDDFEDLGAAVELLPSELNAPQLKMAISRCDYFIGARTHATIAALSSGVPTLSIAYSRKAEGINQDIFGNVDSVIRMEHISADTLINRFDWLVSESENLSAVLKSKQPVWRADVESAVAEVAKMLRKTSV